VTALSNIYQNLTFTDPALENTPCIPAKDNILRPPQLMLSGATEDIKKKVPLNRGGFVGDHWLLNPRRLTAQTKEDLLYYSGIDLHRDTCVITTLDDSGRKVKAKNLPTDPEQIQQYFARLPGDHRAVVECTTGWYWLSDLCHDLGIDLNLAHAKYLKAIAYAKVKTDTVDAGTMAHVLRLGFIPQAHQIARERRGLRDLLRHRLRLVGTRSRLQTQAQAVLLQGNQGPVAGKLLRQIDALEAHLDTTFDPAIRLQLETFAAQ